MSNENISTPPVASVYQTDREKENGTNVNDDSAIPSSAASATLRAQPVQRRRGQVGWLLSIRPFQGIVRDIRARAPWYWSDWKDAWNYRVIPATALIFFAK